MTIQNLFTQDRLVRRLDPRVSCRSDIWKVADFLEIQSIVGKDRAETLLRTYVLHLGLASAVVRAAAFDASQMRETVHDLKSMSGQLGFEALQCFCDDVLAAGNTAPIGELIEPLLALIEVSTEAAQSLCCWPKTGDLSADHSQVA